MSRWNVRFYPPSPDGSMRRWVVVFWRWHNGQLERRATRACETCAEAWAEGEKFLEQQSDE
jgi:hypothetical protein